MSIPAITEDRDIPVLERLEGGLRGLSGRWLPGAPELDGFFKRWDAAWNEHDLDLLGRLVTEDIVCEDPAMFGQTARSRTEFLAFVETFFRAFPDVQIEETGSIYFSLEGEGIALPWRMTGTFSGELQSWNTSAGSEPLITPPTGRPFDLEGVDLYEFRDGLICNYSIVYDLLGMSAQMGLLG